MKVLVIGSGGREHALAAALAGGSSGWQVVSSPGNPGMATVGRVVAGDGDWLDLSAGVDLVVIGPEAPLVAGLADRIRAQGTPVFGPSAAAARLEASKAESKRFMATHGIPTAEFGVYREAVEAMAHVRRLGQPMVVKADGLAGGKGVLVPESVEATETAIRRILVDREFGDAGASIVLEERLSGPELSVMAICDGTRWMLMPTSRDHKRLEDGDEGPNTGGMGAYAPVSDLEPGLLSDVEERVIAPTVSGMSRAGNPFVGCLYVGLMLTAEGPRVLEFNVRFGDPETQALMPLLEGDVAGLFRSAAVGRLEPDRVRIRDATAATVVMAAERYPVNPRLGDPIEGLEEEVEGARVYQAGTRRNDSGGVDTAGGRVLAVTGMGENLDRALDVAYERVEKIRFRGAQYRRDIGRIRH